MHDGETRKGQPLARKEPGRSDEVLAPGTVVGRFIIHRTLGMGSAGVVYAAHDPKLDRTIALKVLRRELADRSDARARFLREAQALARLSHPNVISVYDVGAVAGRTFIAMEYIAGKTFGDWLATSRARWPEVVAMLIKAGRGLAAAHAAGLVHRDFKPANLLVGAGGRVVVTDFGLARAVAEEDSHPGVDAAGLLGRGSAFSRSITHTGAVQGTPAYMAPEQHEGAVGDARADQFSFCVTLYEALFHEHPFLWSRSSLTAVAANELAGTHRSDGVETAAPSPSDRRGVPAWLERAVQRGLASRPEDRFPNMDSILTALGREPVWRRRRTQLGLALAAAMIGGSLAAAFAAVNDTRKESCTGAQEEVALIWNASAASRLQASFASTDRPHAQATAVRVKQRLDRYTHNWVSMHRTSCLATARGEQSPQLLDRQMACLGRRLGQVRNLLELVSRADGELVDRAIDMVGALEPLPMCAGSVALRARITPPVEAGRRARVTELERRIDRAELDRRAGRPQAAADEARAVLEAEPMVDYPPLAAQAGRVLGRALDDLSRPAEAREALLRAQGHAERAGDARLAAHLMLDLVGIIGLMEQRRPEARLLAQLAEAALERTELRKDQMLRARLLAVLGSLANEEGQVDRAIQLHREVLAIHRAMDPLSAEAAAAENFLANALSNANHNVEARAHYQEALAMRRRIFGDEHPLTAGIQMNLAVTAMQEGNTAEARRHYLAALAILERISSHPSYPMLLTNLGLLESDLGNHDLARTYHETALAEFLRRLGPDHPFVATAQNNLALVFRETGRVAEALALHRQALASKEKALGKKSPQYANGLVAIGEDLRRLGRAEEALHHLEQALKIFRPSMPEYPLVRYALAYKGLALLALGRRRQAIPVLEKAVEMIEASDQARARAVFGLARALEPTRPTSPRAVALAKESLEIFTKLRATGERDEVAAYLARVKR